MASAGRSGFLLKGRALDGAVRSIKARESLSCKVDVCVVRFRWTLCDIVSRQSLGLEDVFSLASVVEPVVLFGIYIIPTAHLHHRRFV
jgi:hypothetical protein